MNKNNRKVNDIFLSIVGLSNDLKDGLIGDEEQTSLMEEISEGLLKAGETVKENL